MSNFRIMVEAFTAVMEVYIMALYFKIFMKKWVSLFLQLLFGFIAFLDITLINVLTEGTMIQMLGFISSMVIFSFCYKSSFLKRCYCILSLYLFMTIAEIIVGIILTMVLDIDIAHVRNNDVFYLQGAVLSKLLLLMILKLVGVFKLKTDDKLNLKSIFSLVLIPLSAIVSIYVFNALAYEKGIITNVQALLLVIMMCGSSIAAFYLMENQMKAREVEKRLYDVQNQYNMQTQYYKNMKEMTLLTNKNAHDIKNFLIGVRSYLEQDRIEEAEMRIDEFYSGIPIASEQSSGNTTIDALITSKMEQITKICPNNKVSVVLSDLNDVDEIDLCVLLGNAIDNAIEESQRIEDIDNRFIEIRVMPIKEYISILVVNNRRTTNNDNDVKTSKKDKLLHGFGIENMQAVCDKYQGDLSINKTEDKFYVSILLPNNQKSLTLLQN